MNFAQIRQLIVLLLSSYHLAASILWNRSSYFWTNRQEAVAGTLEALQKRCKRGVFRHLLETFVLCIYAGMIPTKLRGMFGVSEQTIEVAMDFSKDVGMGVPQGPRDSLIFGDLIAASCSSSPDEAEYAFHEMLKMMERLDPLQNQDSLVSAYQVISSWTDLRHGQEKRYSIVLDELPFLVELAAQIPRLKSCRTSLVKFLAKCLQAPEFRRQAVTAICVLLERNQMPDDVLREDIIPRMFDLAVDGPGTQEEQRLEMATALTRIVTSNVLDRRWIYENFLWQYSRMLSDSMFHIRKVSLSIFGDLSKLYGERFTELFLVPHLIALSADNSWSVRKCVCEVFVEVARNSRRHIRAQILTPRFVRLLRDSSRWVCYAAFQELGPFISTFADSTVTGLRIQNGKVCLTDTTNAKDAESPDMDTTSVPDPLYNELPSRIWLPSDTISPFAATTESNCVSQLCDIYNNSYRRTSTQSAPPNVGSDDSSLSSSSGVAAKCSSYENLADSELYGDDDDAMDLDTTVVDERLEESEKKIDDDLSPMTYWSMGFESFSIDDDELLAFGSNSTPPSAVRFLEKRLDILSISLENVSPATSPVASALTSPRRSRTSSDASSISPNAKPTTSEISTISVIEEDLFPDCRGTDDSEDELIEQEQDDMIDDSSHVPPELIETFMSMVSNGSGLDADVNRFSAFNFPAVAYTLGRDNWPLLKDTYCRLVADDQWRVRVSLASSLHEMARIIGDFYTDVDLLPVYNAFREDVPEVRVQLLKHLYEFCQCLSKESRIQAIQSLPQFMSFDSGALSNNWRFRLEFANQCLRLCELCEVNELNRTMSAIALTLSNDKVSAVRVEAVKLVAYILEKLVLQDWPKIQEDTSDTELPNQTLAEIFVHDIVSGFAKSQKWIRRQTFSAMCHYIIENKTFSDDQFRFFLLPHLITMATDRVPNVRIAVIAALNLLQRDEKPAPLFGEITASVGDILKRLLNDTDMDVSREARRACGADVSCELIDTSDRAIRQGILLDEFLEQRCGDMRDNADMSMSPNSSTSSA